jgi:cell division protein FtsL
MDAHVLGRAALTFAFLLCSLGLVTWRQSRAFEANQALDELRRQVSVVQAEQIELERDLQVRRSLGNIVEAAEAIGMVTPSAEQIVILGKGGES